LGAHVDSTLQMRDWAPPCRFGWRAHGHEGTAAATVAVATVLTKQYSVVPAAPQYLWTLVV